MGRYAISLQPANAGLTIDGAPARLEADRTLLLDPGEHVLAARRPDHRDATRRSMCEAARERG